MEAKTCLGIFRVIWDNVPWPNIRNPTIAIPPYIITHKRILHNKKGVKYPREKASKTSTMHQNHVYVPYYQCLAKFCFISHWLVDIWKHSMPRKAKSIYTNREWNTTPVHQFTSLMEPNSSCYTNKNHRNNYQHRCKDPTSCKINNKTLDELPIESPSLKTPQKKFLTPERNEITRRSLNQTVGRTIRAVKIPKKCKESSWKPPQFKDAPGNSLVRLSPSKIINSTQYDCTHWKKEKIQDSAWVFIAYGSSNM